MLFNNKVTMSSIYMSEDLNFIVLYRRQKPSNNYFQILCSCNPEHNTYLTLSCRVSYVPRPAKAVNASRQVKQ